MTQVQVEIVEEAGVEVVEVIHPGPQGPPGTGGGGASQSVRIDSSTANTIYVGKAPAGASESFSVWAVTRLTFTAAGVLLTTRTDSGAWTARASLPYI